MSTSMCLRCLKRALTDMESAAAPNTVQRAAFSTSPSLAANPVKKKGTVSAVSTRQGRTLKLTKNTRTTNVKPPAPGERKELHKRVVLSNTNALEVPGLQDFTARAARSDEELSAAQGKVLGFKDETVDTLRALEAFKPTQAWRFFRRPAALIRKETVQIAKDLEDVTGGASVRKVLFGERGNGKSVLQLQVLAMASLQHWIVVHVPEAKDLTIGHTSYQPISTADGTLYIQPHYTAKLLHNILMANQIVLSALEVSKQHKLPVSLQAGTSLAALANIGARNPDVAFAVWEALWSELLSPSNDEDKSLARPPVIFTLDGMDHIMRLSSYLNAESEPIHAHKLTLVRHFVNLLSGKIALPNGGMILGAVSESNRAASPTLDHYLEANLAKQVGEDPPRWDPYLAHDKWVEEVMQSVDVMKLQGLSKDEARGIMEYYARSGMMRSAVTNGFVSEKWTLAGGGIIGQIEQATVRARF